MSEEISTVGRQVAKFRRDMKMSAEDLAARAGEGLTRSIVANLENGRKADLSARQLLAVALTLGVSPVDLLFDVTDPYVEIELPGGVRTAQWLARDWFGGYLLAREMFSSVEPGQFESPNDLYTRWGAPRLLRERARTMYALGAHEERIDVLEKVARGVAVEDSHASLGSDLDALRRRARDFRAELYEMDRELRSAGVNIDRPIVYSGVPF